MNKRPMSPFAFPHFWQAATLSVYLTCAVTTAGYAQEAPSPPAPATPGGQQTAPITIAANAPVEILVLLNEKPIVFPKGQTPIQSPSGAVLVPLRGVFESLGATVQFEPANKTITAVRGERTMTLRIGETTAQVGAASVPLAVPAQVINGATLVPLRFVAEAFGAQVKWDAPTHTVQITTGAQQAEKLATPPGGDTPVTGVITGVFPEDSALSVRVAGGDNTRIALAPDATVLARKGSEPGTVAPLLSLRVGDQVTIKRNAQGQGIVAEVVYDERKGIIKSIETLSSGSVLVTLTDGTAVTMAKGAPAQMNANAIAFSDLKAGESVVIRINPNTNEGIGLAVATADNPAPLPPAKLDITSVTQSATANQTLKEGEIVTVTAIGTPGATGTFTVPGVPNAFNLPMKEDPSGTYVGTLTTPGGVTVAKAEILVTLTLGANVSPSAKPEGTLTIDSAAPLLGDASPTPDATVTELRPYFSGTFSDIMPGSGIDPKSVRLLVNNQDVTAQTNVTGTLFSYRPTQDLPAGRTVAQIIVRDMAGNEAKREWAFTLAPVVNPIKVVTVSPEGSPLRSGDTLQVHMEATPGGQAKFSLGTVLVDRAMGETMPGIYEGVYAPRKGDNISRAKVVVTFTPPDLAAGQAPWTRAAGPTVTISAGAPSPPVIDLPAEGASVGGNRVTISGRAQPGATVRLTLRYDGKIRSLIPTSGVSKDGLLNVKADETTGLWKADDVTLDAPRNTSGLKYTLEAVTVTASGDVSAPSVVRFRR